MAAIAIPIAVQVAAALAPQIPAVVQLFEDLFGHSSATGKQTGATAKLPGVVGVLQSTATTMANAGLIPSAGVVDPALPSVLAGAVEQAVAAMKAQGLLGPPAASPNPAGLPTSPSPAGNAGAPSMAFRISGTLQIVSGA
jgi:hypothetical protein